MSAVFQPPPPTPSIVVRESPTQPTSLRDYFIAHAPVKPHDWFMPQMADCPLVPSVSGLPHDPFGDALRSWSNDCLDYSDMTSEQQAWVDARNAAVVEQAAWQAEFRKQLLVQWPAAWADEMLKARAAFGVPEGYVMLSLCPPPVRQPLTLTDALPGGWGIERAASGEIVVTMPDGAGGCVVNQVASAERMFPEEVLYALVSAILAAANAKASP